jgi:hypothetical protein
MPTRLRRLRRLVTYLIILTVCPLLGAWLTGKPLGPYLMFPPIPAKPQAPSFSWAAFFLLAGFLMFSLTPFLSRIIFSRRQPPKQQAKYPFPLWGWLGVALMIISWIVAWNRFAWFEPFQEFTFTPLWLSYILVINALSYRRTGQCLLINHTQHYLALFLVSAVLWWSFEYLNRFIENWYYVGTTDFGPRRYFAFATLPFSTVLPAVLGAAEWLNSFPRISADLNRFRPLKIPISRGLAMALVIAGVMGFTALGMWPRTLSFLVWLLPILLIVGLQSLTEKPALIVDIEAGDWRRISTLAVAGLMCGLFWEMWNSQSLAHWKYSVPYVHHFQIFEMPLLGYAGYLPFGIFCGLFADFILLPLPKKAV